MRTLNQALSTELGPRLKRTVTDLERLGVKLNLIGNSRRCAHGNHQPGVRVDGDAIETPVLERDVLLAVQQLLNALAERPHKVLPQEAEVGVQVDLGAGVALGGLVAPEERPGVQVQLLHRRVYG